MDRMGVGYFRGWVIIRNPYQVTTRASMVTAYCRHAVLANIDLALSPAGGDIIGGGAGGVAEAEGGRRRGSSSRTVLGEMSLSEMRKRVVMVEVKSGVELTESVVAEAISLRHKV